MALLDTVGDQIDDELARTPTLGRLIRRKGTGMDPNSLDYKLSVAATNQPTIPQPRNLPIPEAPDISAQPPATLGREPKAPIQPLGLADRYKTLESQRPQESQFNEGFRNAGLGRKILGTLATIGAGYYGAATHDPSVAGRVEQRMFHPQFSKAMDQYNAQLGDIANEAKLGQTEAETRLGNARAASLENPQPKPTPDKPEDLQHTYADAVADAQSRGVDPAKDPKVQQIADAITALQKQPAPPKENKAVAGQLNGKPAWGVQTDKGWIDPQTSKPIPNFQPAPNYIQGSLPTKTTELLGPDNVMHRYQWNEATNRYDIDLGAAPTGGPAHSIFQAGRIETVGPQLIDDINKNREILGNLGSYYKQWLAGTPVSDPRAAGLMSELMSFAALQPALHGFRAGTAMEAFEKMIGGLAKNPDSTIATINGILKTAGAFNVGGGPAKSAGPKVGEVDNGYRFKGGNPSDPSNWEKVKQ